jgi:hypothetical protein
MPLHALVAMQLNQARIERTAGPPYERRFLVTLTAQL